MNIKNKKLSAYKKSSIVMAGLIGISLSLTACMEDKSENKNVASVTDNFAYEDKPSDKHPIRNDTNANVVANDISQKINQAKEDLKHFSDKHIPKKINTGDHKVINIYDVYVVDGDTIHGLDKSGNKIKVRMTGIDAPESNQPMGQESTDALKECITSENKTLLVVQLNNEIDKYGRTLAKVEDDGVDCNMRQVEEGMAWFYEDYSDKLAYGDKELYLQAQDKARNNNIGVWSMNLQKPWDYRKEGK